MPLSEYDKMRVLDTLDALDYLSQQRVLASESSFERWLNRVLPHIYNKVRQILGGIWRWLTGR